MAGLLDNFKSIWELGAYNVPSLIPMPIPKAPVPASARMLAQSIFNPKEITEKDFTAAERKAMKGATETAMQRAFDNSQDQTYANYLKKIEAMPQDKMVKSVFAPSMVKAGIEREQTVRNMSPSVQYFDYPVDKMYKGYGIGNTPMSSHFIDPAIAMSNVVGRSFYKQDPSGNTVITDTYDFPKGMKMEDYKNWSKPFAAAHIIGETFGRSMPVNINLGLLQQPKKKEQVLLFE